MYALEPARTRANKAAKITNMSQYSSTENGLQETESSGCWKNIRRMTLWAAIDTIAVRNAVGFI